MSKGIGEFDSSKFRSVFFVVIGVCHLGVCAKDVAVRALESGRNGHGLSPGRKLRFLRASISRYVFARKRLLFSEIVLDIA